MPRVDPGVRISIAIVVSALLMLASAGSVLLACEDDCGTGCPVGEGGGRCGAVGFCCPCGLGSRLLHAPPAPPPASPPSADRAVEPAAEAAPTAPPPREILHIPRSLAPAA